MPVILPRRSAAAHACPQQQTAWLVPTACSTGFLRAATPRAAQGLEYGVQGVLALSLILSGKWLCGGAHLALLGYMVHLWAGNKVFVHTTDVFRQLPQQKRQRLVMLAAHTVLFMIIVYRCACAACAAELLAAGAWGWGLAQLLPHRMLLKLPARRLSLTVPPPAPPF